MNIISLIVRENKKYCIFPNYRVNLNTFNRLKKLLIIQSTLYEFIAVFDYYCSQILQQ